MVGEPKSLVDGRRLRSERTRQYIIEAYLALLRHNPRPPTASQIAERAGYSVRSLFERFPDLLSLSFAAADHAFAQANAQAAIRNSGGDRAARIRAQVEEFDSLQRGHVKIATVEGLLASFLSDFISDLDRDHPGISTALTTVGSRAVADMISRHEVDLGFVFGRAPRRDLIELAHMRQSLCVMVAPHHDLAGKQSCTIKDCAGLRVVLPEPSFGIRQEIDRACAQANIQLELCNETNSLAFARAAVAQTGLATFLPREAAMPELTAGTLIAIPLRDKRLEATQVTLVQLASRSVSPTAAYIAQRLVARMKDRSD